MAHIEFAEGLPGIRGPLSFESRHYQAVGRTGGCSIWPEHVDGSRARNDRGLRFFAE